ncbi:MAG: hypothetical protein GY866_30560 [Proteobacteria bacterium]|nr:hypothetical protein [Pseudomonadota bacterium]
MTKSSNMSLVSLLRNSVILELDDDKLVIGYKNIQVFTEEKKQSIETIARGFFHPSIQVLYKENDQGIDKSLRVKHDMAKAKEIEEKKAIASQDSKVAEVFKVFPNSEIRNITILEEK